MKERVGLLLPAKNDELK